MDAATVKGMFEQHFEQAGKDPSAHIRNFEVTIYVAERFEAPEWRARWRAAP